jgi:phosphate transport system substrate-binding protein
VNDDFLHRLRTEPSRQFKARLKERLDRLAREAGPVRPRRGHAMLVAALLIGGGAVAVAALTLRGVMTLPGLTLPWGAPPAAESRSDEGAASSHDARGAPPRGRRQLRRINPWLEGHGGGGSASGAPAQQAAPVSETAAPAASARVSSGVATSEAFSKPPILVIAANRLYPATRDFAEQFSRDGRYPTPRVLSLSASGAIARFCGPRTSEAERADAPQIITTDRRMRQGEAQECVRRGTIAIIEYPVMSEVVLIARSATAGPMALTARDLYLALAHDVPAPPPAQVLIPNPYRTWDQIDPALGGATIVVFGFPSGYADSGVLMDTIMARGCRTFAWIAALEETDGARFRSACRRLREDGVYHGEVDAFAVEQQLLQDPTRLGLFGERFVAEHPQELVASPIDGVEPSAATIAAPTYPGSLPLYVYVASTGVPAYFAKFLNEYLIALRGAGSAYLRPLDARPRSLNLLTPTDLPP